MSISGVGASGGLNQSLAMFLSQLTGSQATTSATGTSPDSFGGCSAPASSPQPEGSPDNNLTGSTKASVSDEILSLLTQLQQMSADPSASATAAASSSSTGITTVSAASTAIGTSSAASDPLKQLMAAMDSDDDGTISQTEMESYIQKQGGTAAQADALFAGLNQNGSGNLTASTLSNDLGQANAAQGGGAARAHHHHHHAPPSANQVGNDLLSAMDSDGSGSVDQSEFESFVTGLGGTTTQADSDFAALDPGSTGSVDAAQFTSAVTALQTANVSGAGSPILSLLDAFKTNTAASAGSTVSVTA